MAYIVFRFISFIPVKHSSVSIQWFWREQRANTFLQYIEIFIHRFIIEYNFRSFFYLHIFESVILERPPQ